MQISLAFYNHAKVIFDPSDFPAAEQMAGTLTEKQLLYWDGTNTSPTLGLLFQAALSVEDEELLTGEPIQVDVDRSSSFAEQYSHILAVRLSASLGRVMDAYTFETTDKVATAFYSLAKKHVYVYRHLENIAEEEAYIDLLHLIYTLGLQGNIPRGDSIERATAKWSKIFDQLAITPTSEWLTRFHKLALVAFAVPTNMANTHETVFLGELAWESNDTIDALFHAIDNIKKNGVLDHHTLLNLKDASGSWDALVQMIESVPADVLETLGSGN